MSLLVYILLVHSFAQTLFAHAHVRLPTFETPIIPKYPVFGVFVCVSSV